MDSHILQNRFCQKDAPREVSHKKNPLYSPFLVLLYNEDASTVHPREPSLVQRNSPKWDVRPS